MADKSPHKWMNALLGMPFDYIKSSVPAATMNPAGSYTNALTNGFYGQSGNTSGGINTGAAQTFADQLHALDGGRPVIVGIMAEVNDMTGGIAAATTWSNYQSMMSKFAAKGWKYLISKCVPSSSLDTATERDNVAALSALFDAASDSRLVRVLDWTVPYKDTSNTTGVTPLSGYTTDGTHLNSKGALALGLKAAQQMDGAYPIWKPSASDVICSQNPTLSGSGGTLGSGASGVVPTGFTLSASGASVVASRAGDYLQLVFSYSGSAWASSTVQGLIADAFTQNAVAGTTYIQNICDVEIVECTNYMWQARNDLGGGTGEIPAINAFSSDNWMDGIAGRRVVLHSEPHLYPGTATRSTTSFGAHPVWGCTNASLTVRLRWMGTKQA